VNIIFFLTILPNKIFFSSFVLFDRNKKDTIEDLFRNLNKTKKQSNHDIDCFFIEQTSIQLNAHETTHFNVQYIATTPKRREALLVFMNETIGEFLFLIEGVPKKPEYILSNIYRFIAHMNFFFFSIDHFPYQVTKQ